MLTQARTKKAFRSKPSGKPSHRLYKSGGRDRDRTCDPYHVKVVLSR
jgi:hypothetical protein